MISNINILAVHHRFYNETNESDNQYHNALIYKNDLIRTNSLAVGRISSNNQDNDEEDKMSNDDNERSKNYRSINTPNSINENNISEEYDNHHFRQIKCPSRVTLCCIKIAVKLNNVVSNNASVKDHQLFLCLDIKLEKNPYD